MTGVRLAVAAAALVLAAAGAAQGAGVEPYEGENPFDCELQQAGTGTEVPDPGADPFCVEYDKTQQNVTGLGAVHFASGEPARVAAASDKCFYYQHDHWRGSVDQHVEQTETYNWDGGYYFDKARGVAGTYVESFTVLNASGNPTGLPGFPSELEPSFGYGRGGLQMEESIPVDPRCVEKAAQGGVYREDGRGARGR